MHKRHSGAMFRLNTCVELLNVRFRLTVVKEATPVRPTFGCFDRTVCTPPSVNSLARKRFLSNFGGEASSEGQNKQEASIGSYQEEEDHISKVIRKKAYQRNKGRAFIDFLRLRVRAGSGGDGCASFRREANLPRGGPDGGNGGDGGSIFLVADGSVTDFRKLSASYVAKRGEHGKGRTMHGRAAADVEIKVPLGTVIKHDDRVVADLDRELVRVRVVTGGKGGKGNVNFKSGENRVPRQFTRGETGEERLLELELKTIADVGLVGFPNAGKSSFLAAVSNAHPKIAAYPFTTLNPYVGCVDYRDHFRLTIADIPGLVKGAHLNVGLGHSFLRHIERSRAFVYIIDASASDGRDPCDDLRDLLDELECYKKEMPQRPALVLANKIDLPGAEENVARLQDMTGLEVIAISAQHQTHISDATGKIRALVESLREESGVAEPQNGLKGKDQLIILKDESRQKPTGPSRFKDRQRKLRFAQAQMSLSTSGG